MVYNGRIISNYNSLTLYSNVTRRRTRSHSRNTKGSANKG